MCFQLYLNTRKTGLSRRVFIYTGIGEVFIQVKMFLLAVIFWICQLGVLSGADRNSGPSLDQPVWYGPSYQPKGWNPDDMLSLRAKEFSYDDPDSWAERFPDCGGFMQSPINIPANGLEQRRTEKALMWRNYANTPKTMVLENSRYSVHGTCIWGEGTSIPFITYGPLQHRYSFSQFHFHWGANSSFGSEHTVDGKRYPMEMHLVHERQDAVLGNLDKNNNSTHLVVIGFMFEVRKQDNANLKPILVRLKEVAGNRKKKTFVDPFPLDALINYFTEDYVTYKGSLTTPPCSEGVVWILSSKPLGISERQLNEFRKSITDVRGIKIENFRPVQKLNRRTIYYVRS